MGDTDHYRLKDRIPSEALSEAQTSSVYTQAGGRRMHGDRDPKHAGQTGHYRVSGQPREVLFPIVPSTKMMAN